MKLASVEAIKFLCHKYGFRPQRSSGQNFLISEKVLSRIVEAAQVNNADTVLEIGAGFGTLTTELVKSAKSVLAVELDRRLAGSLNKMARISNNLTVIEGDIFQKWPVISRQLADGQYKIIANLPYNITSLVLRNFLERPPRPSEMVIMVQKEVAERVVAQPGQMSLLSVAVQFFAKPEIISLVSKENFWPVPEVDSAILRIGVSGGGRGYQGAAGEDKGCQGTSGGVNFFRIVKIGFSARRKQLHNNLSSGLRLDDDAAKEILLASGIKPSTRAQDLSVAEWQKICKNLK